VTSDRGGRISAGVVRDDQATSRIAGDGTKAMSCSAHADGRDRI
jgi:hypothetical protein